MYNTSLTMNEFETTVSSGLIIAYFWSNNSKNHLNIKALLEDIKIKGLKSIDINVEKNNSICEKYSIATFPTLLFFQNGEIIHIQKGLMTKEILDKKISRFFS